MVNGHGNALQVSEARLLILGVSASRTFRWQNGTISYQYARALPPTEWTAFLLFFFKLFSRFSKNIVH